ncbi:uncharacterized protein LOC124420548 [Lucilia cuprina]|uniref:uncharacterized protein LOC124420548 n=1 Tax=Lucilia cuprina TaxID=7375 RepID=UPI001F06E8F7|nr:uncharacterized protein LOC124420548 [Lucilia cuprina]
MKNSTIWESASRPLFVRTVWLEGSELRRGLQRHFLLDYDTKRPLERLNSALNPLQQKRKENLKRSISFELNDFNDLEDLHNNDPDSFLIGSAKVKLHEPSKLAADKKLKLHKSRRSSLYKRKFQSYDSYHTYSSKANSRRPSDISELFSRKNSLQHPQIAETADELLAERVLHWLDLAGKEEFLKNLSELKEMEVKLSKTSKLRQDAIKRYNSKSQNSQRPKPPKSKAGQRAATANAQLSNQRNCKSSEAVKHITIIFNKEGQPIRLNRPAKNIDLCALSHSPSTTRRLAGTLASARLYKSAENPRCLNIPKTQYTKSRNVNEATSARRRLDTVADLTNSTLQKRLHENPMQGTYSNLHDSKKQLHIFMPTLAKKSLLRSAVYAGDDGISELSHNFSELCRI